MILAETVRLSDYRPFDWVIESIDLEFVLDAERTVVSNRMRIHRAAHAPADASLRLDGENLELVSLSLDGAPLNAERIVSHPNAIELLALPEECTLEIVTAVSPAKNKAGKGLFEMSGKFATQCEAEGFRCITFFPDRPDVLSRYSVTIRADKKKYPVLLSNGNPESAGQGDNGQHWVKWIDPFPKPSYIFGLFAGDFGKLEDEFVTASGKHVTLGIYADHNLVPLCRFAMDVVKRSLAWDETTYGLEYDLDVFNIVALTGWAGAMENKGLNLFEAKGIITDPEITTDNDYVIIERIIGHEQFHNWTGNRVTCRDWFQLCLKEGLTRFRDQHFIEDKMADGVWRVEVVQILRRNQFPEDDGPAIHAVRPEAYAEIDNFYTATIYDKGAELIRMLRAMLGTRDFRKGFDLYIVRHDGQAVTTEEFLVAMEDASGRDLSQFRRWYTQAGRPRIKARGNYDAANKRYALTLAQHYLPVPRLEDRQPLHIPIGFGLVSREGRTLPFRAKGATVLQNEAVLELRDRAQTFEFEDVAAPPVPSLLRRFSAPATLDADLSEGDLAILMAHDTDPFARWDAAQTLGVRSIRDLAAKHSAGQAMAPPTAFLDAIGKVLGDDNGDKLARAQLLILPDEPALSESLASIDLDGHMAARNFVRQQIATRFNGELLSLYHAAAEREPYVPDISGIARRKFKNAVLDLLMSLGTKDVAQLCLQQLKTAANMTDMYEALCMLTHLDCPERKEAIAYFYDRWKDHSTVVDKWFGAQALSRMPGVVSEIIALQSHPDCDPENIARGLAFYGGFFRQNRVSFHDPSGAGYEFLADWLISLDRLGRPHSHYFMPQINQWRRYDPLRQSLMKKALMRVANTPNLSKGTTENLSKALS